MKTVEYNMNSLITALFEIAETSGIANPLDKYKYREMQLAELLGHTVFEGASGGANNDATFGADAVEDDGTKAEYKSKTISDADLTRLQNKGYIDFVGVYNGAYSDESIDRYADVNHYFSIHYKGDVVAILKADTDYVINSLREYNDKREEKTKKLIAEANGKKVKLPTTNCNSVKVRYDVEQGSSVGDIIYWNDKYAV